MRGLGNKLEQISYDDFLKLIGMEGCTHMELQKKFDVGYMTAVNWKNSRGYVPAEIVLLAFKMGLMTGAQLKSALKMKKPD
jgi:hypothetical protein